MSVIFIFSHSSMSLLSISSSLLSRTLIIDIPFAVRKESRLISIFLFCYCTSIRWIEMAHHTPLSCFGYVFFRINLSFYSVSIYSIASLHFHFNDFIAILHSLKPRRTIIQGCFHLQVPDVRGHNEGQDL